jgi:Spy/CpxP family protein refolding chaperone
MKELNKKIKELSEKEMSKLNKMLGECQIISFDPKKMSKRIKKSYELRTKAHELMLKADVLLDGILKDLYGNNA